MIFSQLPRREKRSRHLSPSAAVVNAAVFVSATDPSQDLYGSRLLISTSSAEIRLEFLPARSRKAGANSRTAESSIYLIMRRDNNSDARYRDKLYEIIRQQ